MKTSPNPLSGTIGSTGGALDRQLHPLDASPNVAGTSPTGVKRRARSAFIEAITELMAMPGLDARSPAP